MKFRGLFAVCLFLVLFPVIASAQDGAGAVNAALRDLSSALGVTLTTNNVQNYNWSQEVFSTVALGCGGSEVVGGVTGFQVFITYNGRIYDYRVSVDLNTVILCSGSPADGSATSTPVPAPTSTPVPASGSSEDTTSADGCFGFAQIRLQAGGFGRVISDVSANNIRSIPATDGELLGQIPPRATFEVLEGPSCTDDDRAWWRVRYNDIEGWTSEGAGSDYLVEPITADDVSATVSAPTPTPAPTEAFACPGFQPSQLVIGGLGRVTSGSSNNLRSIPEQSGELLGQIPTGDSFTVLEGPTCDESGIAWWRVDYAGITGWTAEGQGTEYYVEPFGAAPTPAPQQVSSLVAITTATVGQVSSIANLGWGIVYDAAWSPDGDELAILSTTGVRVFDTGDLTSAPLQSLNFIQSVPFDIRYVPDGRLAITFYNLDSGLWDTRTGEQVLTFGERDIPLDNMIFFEESTTASYVTSAGIMRDVDLTTGSVSEIGTNRVSGIYSPNGSLVASVSADDGQIHVLAAEDGSETFTAAGALPAAMTTVFSPDSAFLVTASDKGEVLIWDVTSGETASEIALPEGETTILDLDISADGSTLSALYSSGSVQVWDFPDGSLRSRLSHGTAPQQHELSADGNQLIIYGGSWASVWNTTSGEQLERLDQYAGEVLDARISPDGTRITTAHADGTVRVWDSTTWQMLSLISTLQSTSQEVNPVFAVEYSPDGTQLAAANNSIIAVYDALSMEERSRWSNTNDSGTYIDLAFSPDGTQLASAQGTIRLWDPLTGTLASEIASEGATTLTFSPDGSQIVTNSTTQPGMVTVWDTKAGTAAGTIEPTADFAVQRMAFSPDGTLLAIGDNNSTLYIYDTATLEQMQAVSLGQGLTWVYSMAFNIDGTLLAVGMGSGEGIALIDPAKGQVLQQVTPSSARGLWASSIQFYPDSSRLLAGWGTGDGGGDGTFTLFGISTGG